MLHKKKSGALRAGIIWGLRAPRPPSHRASLAGLREKAIFCLLTSTDPLKKRCCSGQPLPGQAKASQAKMYLLYNICSLLVSYYLYKLLHNISLDFCVFVMLQHFLSFLDFRRMCKSIRDDIIHAFSLQYFSYSFRKI